VTLLELLAWLAVALLSSLGLYVYLRRRPEPWRVAALEHLALTSAEDRAPQMAPGNRTGEVK